MLKTYRFSYTAPTPVSRLFNIDAAQAFNYQVSSMKYLHLTRARTGSPEDLTDATVPPLI